MTTTTMTHSPAAPLTVADGLSPQLQRHIDRTLAADRKGGEALWEKACAVADARADAQHGEWGRYLEATKQNERAAQRLVSIAERGRAESRFRDAVITGFLSFSVAALTSQADDQLLTTLMESPTPPTRYEAQALIANPTPVSGLPLAPPVVPAAVPLDQLTEPLTEEEYFDLSWLGGFESDQTADRFTPAGFRLVTLTDTRHPDGWTPTTRSVGTWRHDLAQLRTEAERKAERKAAQQAHAPRPKLPVTAPIPVVTVPVECMHCGYAKLSTRHHCGSCYLLIEAQKWTAGSEDMRWRLKAAERATEKMPEELRRARVAEIRSVAEANHIDIDVPVIAAPFKVREEAPVAPVAKAEADPRQVLLAHGAALLAVLIEHCSEPEQRLLLALFDGEYLIPGQDEVWLAGHILLGNLPTPTLRWIETGKEDSA